MVAAIAALMSSLPLRQRLGPSDLVLPADSFSHSYVLCLTMAALFSHSSLAINSVSGAGVDLALAARGVAPTVMIASSQSLAKLHKAHMAGVASGFQKLAHSNQFRALAAGRMPGEDLLVRLFAPKGSAIGTSPGKVRLIFSSERVGTDSGFEALSSTTLSDLRIATRSRICYALTAASVAGAVAQTNVYDYRHNDRPGHSHFGAPLSSVEIKLVDKDDSKVDGSTPSGEVSSFLFLDSANVAANKCGRLLCRDLQLLVVRAILECVVPSVRIALWLMHESTYCVYNPKTYWLPCSVQFVLFVLKQVVAIKTSQGRYR